MKAVVAKQFIEKARGEVKEKERKQEIICMFEKVFGFYPDWVEWVNDGGQRVLQAQATAEEIEDFIQGQKIERVVFHLIEDKNLEHNIDWKYSNFSSGIYNVYKWSKNLKSYRAIVKIFVK